MAEYEVVREIFNQCSGNQMRDVFFEEVEIDDVHAYLNRYRQGKSLQETRFDNPDGSFSYLLEEEGMTQRITFQEI